VDVGRYGRRVRIAATLLLTVGILYGTLWGDDDDFPFAPFKMYGDSRELNEPVGDTQMVAVDESGDEFRFTQDLTGVRRAEIEGQLTRFEDDPSLLRFFAEAYESRFPDRPRVDEVRIVIEWIEIHEGEPTGDSTVEEIATWQR
jgi:hypothetical protein